MIKYPDAWWTCPCGHFGIQHDVYEYRGDGSETCCVEGCSQVGCPGRNNEEEDE